MLLQVAFDYLTAESKLRILAVNRAKCSLWKDAVKDLRITYPDPQADVELLVYGEGVTGAVCIDFSISDVIDSRDPERMRRMTIKHVGYPQSWFGARAARLYTAGLWAAFMLHEALELCRVRGPWGDDIGPQVDPHVEGGHIGDFILRQTGDVIKFMELVVGTKVADTIVNQDKDVAQKQLTAEIQKGT